MAATTEASPPAVLAEAVQAPRRTRRRRTPDPNREQVRGFDKLWVFVFLAPFLLLYLGFTLWPLIATIYYSFFDWDGIGPINDFVGVGNYNSILNDKLFWLAVVNTLIFAVLNTVIKLPLSLLMAIVLTRKWLRGTKLFRTVFFAPLIIPARWPGWSSPTC